jgi:hypothetical protein
MSQYWSVEQSRGLKSTMIGRAWMSMYLLFSPVLRDYESRFSSHFRLIIITFELRSVLHVFLVGIYALFWRILVAYLTQSRACTFCKVSDLEGKTSSRKKNIFLRLQAELLVEACCTRVVCLIRTPGNRATVLPYNVRSPREAIISGLFIS